MLCIASPRSELSVIKVCNSAPPISHLFFANDSLIFFKATRRCTDELKEILTTYGKLSGQKVIYGKSEIWFRNIGQPDRLALCISIRVEVVQSHGKYIFGLTFRVWQQQKTGLQ